MPDAGDVLVQEAGVPNPTEGGSDALQDDGPRIPAAVPGDPRTAAQQELDRYVGELKARHDDWKAMLTQAKPASGESQIASEALEIALKELADHFSAESSETDEPPSVEAAKAYLRRHTPPA
jgi:hypothetical protein